MHRGWYFVIYGILFVIFLWWTVSMGRNVSQRSGWNDSLLKHQFYITGSGRVHSFPRATLISGGTETDYLVEYPVTVVVTTNGDSDTYTRTLFKEGATPSASGQYVDCYVVKGSEVQVVGQEMPTGWLIFYPIMCALVMVTFLVLFAVVMWNMLNTESAVQRQKRKDADQAIIHPMGGRGFMGAQNPYNSNVK